MKRTTLPQHAPATDTISYAGYRFPPDAISYAVWLYYRFPLSLRMVEELLAARGIDLTYETVNWLYMNASHCASVSCVPTSTGWVAAVYPALLQPILRCGPR